jgi:glycerophosphoryl diester phosphodiesterase
MRVPLVTSHAACKGHAPENTLAGIERALALGADAIEIDVHCTADGVPVLLHDDTVDRTTDGSGDVCEMTFEQIRALNAGARQFTPRFAGAQIPSLAEVLGLTTGRVLLQIEVKQPAIERHVAEAVRAAGAVEWCEVHSFLPRVVSAVRAEEPRMAAALLVAPGRVADWEKLYGFALSLNAQGISVHYSEVTEGVVRRAQRRGLTFMCWTVDEAPDIARMAGAGVDSICSDFPDLVRRTLDESLAAAHPGR